PGYQPKDWATISAMSSTCTLSSFSLFFTPSKSIVVQNGQLAAITEAPVSSASSALSILIRLSPGSSSLNICAPPAPQQSPLVLQRFISTNSTSKASNTARGASYTPLALPR